MNKELVFKKEMRAFDINVDDIKPDEHIFGAIEEAIIKLKEQLLVTQTNEETFRLEMKDITQTLGLD